jgi:glycosyltransferase involved in cell wall biosynthesis
MRVRIFTDLRFAAMTTPTGVGKHLYYMVRGLADVQGYQVSLLAASDQAKNSGVLSFLPIKKMPMSWNAASALWTAISRPYADRWVGEADWVYCPKNDWIPLRNTRLAVTIHGAHELDPAMPHPTHFIQRIYRMRNRIQYVKMCREATVVFTVSEFLRAKICEWFEADPDKVVVVGNGVEAAYFAAGECGEKLSLPGEEPYVLALGGLNYLDGGDRLVTIANEIARVGLGIRIKVAGRQHDPAMVAAARGRAGLELLGYVPAQRLAPLMTGAAALLYLTRYETFGMGAAEAMASGTVVITCRNTAVPEIVGDAGIYIDPDDPVLAVETIQSVLADSELRAAHIDRGRRRAVVYTWSACVDRVRRELEHRLP